MIVVTTNDIPGYRIDAVLGEVMGMTVRSANIGANFVAGFRAMGGGEVKEYTKLVYESRQEVMHRMVEEAQRRGANAVVGMRFDTGDIAQSFSEVCAYGTAVVANPIAAGQPGATTQSSHQAAGGHQQQQAPAQPAYGQQPPQDAPPTWR
ncbi:YbjQ family protein [Cellulosimicrobium terreum]|nr:YbjQ family protein [Cellulosimicrobium terreum]